MHDLNSEPMGDLTNPPHKDEKIHELKLAYLSYAHNSQITSICIIYTARQNNKCNWQNKAHQENLI
jgi:hypothetical protein